MPSTIHRPARICKPNGDIQTIEPDDKIISVQVSQEFEDSSRNQRPVDDLMHEDLSFNNEIYPRIGQEIDPLSYSDWPQEDITMLQEIVFEIQHLIISAYELKQVNSDTS